MGRHGQHDPPRGGDKLAGRDECLGQDRARAHQCVDVTRAGGPYVSVPPLRALPGPRSWIVLVNQAGAYALMGCMMSSVSRRLVPSESGRHRGTLEGWRLVERECSELALSCPDSPAETRRSPSSASIR